MRREEGEKGGGGVVVGGVVGVFGGGEERGEVFRKGGEQALLLESVDGLQGGELPAGLRGQTRFLLGGLLGRHLLLLL